MSIRSIKAAAALGYSVQGIKVSEILNFHFLEIPDD